MIKLIENLTQKELTYALVGTTLRVYAWTVLSIVTYFIFKMFNTKFKSDPNLKIHYLFLIVIPLFLANIVTLSINLETTTPLLVADMIAFTGGILMLATFLGVYFYLKGRGKL